MNPITMGVTIITTFMRPQTKAQRAALAILLRILLFSSDSLRVCSRRALSSGLMKKIVAENLFPG